MTEHISYDDFKKLDLRVATIANARRVEGSEKLLELSLTVGEESRTIVAGIGNTYEPEALPGREIIIVANLAPRTLMGIESNGMLLAADDEGPVLIVPDHEVASGAIIK